MDEFWTTPIGRSAHTLSIVVAALALLAVWVGVVQVLISLPREADYDTLSLYGGGRTVLYILGAVAIFIPGLMRLVYMMDEK